MPTRNPDRDEVPPLHVVVGLVFNIDGQVLVQQRTGPPAVAGLWEFPGGKVEPAEDCPQALIRELREELGIDVTSSEPFMRVLHHYPERSVMLDVFRVLRWQGEASGAEGQPIRFASVDELPRFQMLEAAAVMVDALLRQTGLNHE